MERQGVPRHWITGPEGLYGWAFWTGAVLLLWVWWIAGTVRERPARFVAATTAISVAVVAVEPVAATIGNAAYLPGVFAAGEFITGHRNRDVVGWVTGTVATSLILVFAATIITVTGIYGPVVVCAVIISSAGTRGGTFGWTPWYWTETTAPVPVEANVVVGPTEPVR